jgi:hypothetical protein
MRLAADYSRMSERARDLWDALCELSYQLGRVAGRFVVVLVIAAVFVVVIVGAYALQDWMHHDPDLSRADHPSYWGYPEHK